MAHGSRHGSCASSRRNMGNASCTSKLPKVQQLPAKNRNVIWNLKTMKTVLSFDVFISNFSEVEAVNNLIKGNKIK